ncbi:MAG: hypothetical protein QME71_10795 [Dehalococcoidia bacterium]|nr:hypothetical protein [Dehalococcoidia bacterium]
MCGKNGSTRFLLPLMLALAAALLLSCGGGGDDSAATPSVLPRDLNIGAPRSFELGVGAFPSEPTRQGYEKAFVFAAEAGELVLIQRAPPWKEFLPGGALSDDTRQTTAEEKRLTDENGLSLLYAIDPTDPADRSRLQGLPEGIKDRTFANKDVRKAFVNYAKYVALNYHPKLLALGVEVNMYYHRQPDDFDNFLSLYAEAYDAVKSVSPDTLVFPIFQLEEMYGLIGSEKELSREWTLLRRFEPRLDVAAFSTYPSFVFENVDSMPDDYWKKIAEHTSRPIAIASAGYSSETGREGLSTGSEADQAAFVQRLLSEAEALKMPFVVWLTGHDPALPAEAPFDLYNHMGLCRSDASYKPAWYLWLEQAMRPLDDDLKAAGE